MLNKILKGAILTAKTADVDFSGVAISGSKLTRRCGQVPLPARAFEIFFNHFADFVRELPII